MIEWYVKTHPRGPYSTWQRDLAGAKLYKRVLCTECSCSGIVE